MKKTLLLVFIGVLFCALAYSQGTLATGEWFEFADAADGGDSTAVMKEARETIDGQAVTTYAISGNVTTKFQYGFAGWGVRPDPATLALLKTCSSISFKVLGDGRRYTLKFPISDVRDHGYHEYSFNTTAGQVQTVTIQMRQFMQPSWAQSVRMRQANVDRLEFQTHESWRPGTFSIKVWDLRLIP